MLLVLPSHLGQAPRHRREVPRLPRDAEVAGEEGRVIQTPLSSLRFLSLHGRCHFIDSFLSFSHRPSLFSYPIYPHVHTSTAALFTPHRRRKEEESFVVISFSGLIDVVPAYRALSSSSLCLRASCLALVSPSRVAACSSLFSSFISRRPPLLVSCTLRPLLPLLTRVAKHPCAPPAVPRSDSAPSSLNLAPAVLRRNTSMARASKSTEGDEPLSQQVRASLAVRGDGERADLDGANSSRV